jgi:HD superfamily phosphohydrolase YqeK
MIHENKFKLVDIDSGDSKAVQRIITGKITKARRKQIEHAARVFNREWAAPYGISPNGYAYNCGCEHDCCGCLTGKGASVSYERWGKNDCAIITIWTSYNY